MFNWLGRHPCAGMKVAKLEIKMIVAFFVVGYEYDVVDSKSRIVERLPVPDYNDLQHVSIFFDKPTFFAMADCVIYFYDDT
jgi:cytochrome P450